MITVLLGFYLYDHAGAFGSVHVADDQGGHGCARLVALRVVLFAHESTLAGAEGVGREKLCRIVL